MKRIDKFFIKLQADLLSAYEEFVASERGDTNFISMLLIIGIVVVLAGLFLTIGKSTMTTIGTKIREFLDNL